MTATIAKPSARPQADVDRVRAVALHSILLVVSSIYLVPFYWMVSTSLKQAGREITVPPQWVPNPIAWDNYWRVFVVVPFAQLAVNSAFITVTATAFGVLAASLAGYAFARLRFPGRDRLFSLCVASLMLPSIVTLIPEFLIFKNLGLIDTYAPLILPWSLGGSAFAVFLFRQFARSIPADLDEAARVDGAGNFQIWWMIILPLSRPVLATMAILSIIHHWNEFLRPLVYLYTPSKRTLAIGLAMFKSEYLVQWNMMMAASTLMLIPVVLLFFFAQRHFVRGIVMSGLKG